MRNIKLFLTVFNIVYCSLNLSAQDKVDYKFGKITAADFRASNPQIDSGANALIIADIGSSSFEGNNSGSFTLVYTRFVRVKILNKAGLNVGSFAISLYHNKEGDAEKISSIKGSTFNIENGTIAETKLDEKSLYTETYNKEINIRKFSLPALREGSIFDVQYTIKSPFDGRLQPWSFQGENPCLWSEYTVTIPPPYHYMTAFQGDQHFDIQTNKEVFGSFEIKEQNTNGKTEATHSNTSQSDEIRITGSSREFRWVKKNVPALHLQPYTTTLSNYVSRIAFQLNYFQWVTVYGSQDKHEYLPDWSSTARVMLSDEKFGMELSHENGWMKDEMKAVIEGSRSDEEKAHRIFNFVRDNFIATGKEGYNKNEIWIQSSLKDVYRKKIGNVAEINLLLTAMLRQADIAADPLILSTRNNGIVNPVYPLLDQYNYVICIAKPGNKLVALDASQAFNAYGQLPSICYNGSGHIMNEKTPSLLYFSADSVVESNVTSVFIVNDEKGSPSGNMKTVFGKNSSAQQRMEIKMSSLKAYEQKLQTNIGEDRPIENFGADSLNKYDFPLAIHFDFNCKNLTKGDVLYFNPMLDCGMKSNPFSAMDRLYPVEMPYKIDDTYLFNMEIPVGYQIDELPKSARVAYNENEGFFEYLIQKGENSIQMRVRLRFNKAFFPTEEYASLRDFYAFVVSKESEQIVFKKTH